MTANNSQPFPSSSPAPTESSKSTTSSSHPHYATSISSFMTEEDSRHNDINGTRALGKTDSAATVTITPPNQKSGSRVASCFGQGWHSTMLSPSSVIMEDTSFPGPIDGPRSRSPSTPNLPSDAQRAAAFNPAPGADRRLLKQQQAFVRSGIITDTPSCRGPSNRLDSFSPVEGRSLAHSPSDSVLVTGFHAKNDGFGQYLGTKESLVGLGSMGQGRNVYIPHFNKSMTQHQLHEFARKFGTVMSVKINNDLGPFLFHEHASAFMRSLLALGIDCEFGREDWNTEYRALEDRQSSNMYIQGLAPDDTDADVRELVKPAVIVSCKRLTDCQGNLRDICMARVQSREQADHVIRKLDGKSHPRTGAKLSLRIADSEAQKELKKVRNLHTGKPGSNEHLGFSHSNSFEVLREPAYDFYSGDMQSSRSDLVLRQQQLFAELEAISAALSNIPLPPSDLPLTPDTPSAPAYHHRHTSSNASYEVSGGTYTHRFPNNPFTPWPATPTVSRTVSTSSMSGNTALGHRRSTATLATQSHNPARLLWGEDR
ncbi:hypothetical protein TREMEDRAFT_60177 [Tremella mesenterica DSM 1558]|uniref:uncharacterized protein n=1 Tax=Tremella mesenterica (strain ATCC 24925 / CBS 8224 / DSM 1558 / NBRC 9311 / NRRL Y-6157 / RJB 2259-6 / UBC 559-6) TaxID=578456 RepID=UPI0003F4A3AC|nr:uncharacterized protein TREMEDRAFT_60177 [Tremella mesenterica DSM 1558]EIW71243.1 hypothetical protein TREMEDRAFT_60177 [Tremella mesenterica DSM 1558]